jgi:serine/threonine protein kinase
VRAPALDQTAPATPETGAVAPEADDRAAGELVGKYRLTRRLGQGGMGSVHAGVHVVIGRPVALKFLHARFAPNDVLVRRLRREAAAAGALVSEHVAAVNDFDVTSDGTPFIVMELLEGESLATRIRRGPLAVDEAVRLGIQICRGLGVAHRSGIVHRDLTPGNVFLTKSASGETIAKILDFGIALADASQDAPTTANAPAGTAPYMAPEQARGERMDGRADLYSLGTILYEALSGRRAHPGEQYHQILHHVLHQDVEPLRRRSPDVPAALAAIVTKALATRPTARFATAAELETALSSFRQETPSAPGRRRWPSAFVAAAALVAITAARVGGGRVPSRPALSTEVPVESRPTGGTPPPAATAPHRHAARGHPSRRAPAHPANPPALQAAAPGPGR